MTPCLTVIEPEKEYAVWSSGHYGGSDSRDLQCIVGLQQQQAHHIAVGCAKRCSLLLSGNHSTNYLSRECRYITTLTLAAITTCRSDTPQTSLHHSKHALNSSIGHVSGPEKHHWIHPTTAEAHRASAHLSTFETTPCSALAIISGSLNSPQQTPYTRVEGQTPVSTAKQSAISEDQFETNNTQPREALEFMFRD